jgi:putative CRISPR-associated protein (TIGR02619 family)
LRKLKLVNIIATVGTSIITNKRELADNIKNYNLKDEKKLNEIVLKYFPTISGKESAELQTLIKIINRYQDGVDFCIYLLSSDTDDSYFCANVDKILLIKYFPKRKIDVKINRIEGLVVDDYNKFKNQGIRNFIKLINELTIEKRDNNFLLCISGGFKGFIPIMTIVGQLFDIKSYYIFEKSDVLIEIPVLPFNFDYEELFEIYSGKNNEKRLKEFGFLDETNQETIIGKLTKSLYEEKIPFLIEVWGRIIEFLVFEYFVENPYKTSNGQNLNFVSRDKKIDGKEFDIVFSNKKDGEPVAAMEIKPLNTLYNRFDEFMKQASQQIEVINKRNIKEYCLLIYSLEVNEIKSEIINKIQDIKRLCADKKINMRLFCFNVKEKIKNINLNNRYKNEKNKFSLILQSKINNYELVETTL